MSSDDPFRFFKVVCVTGSGKFPDLVGQFGYVMGKSWRYEEPTPHGPVDAYGGATPLVRTARTEVVRLSPRHRNG
jgi:hypothetical protein